MQTQSLTIGATAAAVSFTVTPALGVTLLARAANTGSVYIGTSSGVTTSTGVLIPKGAVGTIDPFVVPAESFDGGPGTLYLIASAADQVVDVVSQ
jgi:hypothetical protein